VDARTTPGLEEPSAGGSKRCVAGIHGFFPVRGHGKKNTFQSQRSPLMFMRTILFVLTNILVLLTITAIFLILVYVLGIDLDEGPYQSLLLMFLAMGMFGSFISLWLSRIIAKKSMGVHVIDPRNPGEFRDLVDTVHRLSRQAGLSVMPEVGVYTSLDINAFATGPSRNRSLVAVSTGLLQRMDRDQIEGVLAHEVAHVANGDMVTMTLIQGVINAFVLFFAYVIAAAISSALRRGSSGHGSSMMSTMMFMMLFQVYQSVYGALGFIVVAWFSRRRVFRADHGGALYAGKEKMISALRVLQRIYDQPPTIMKRPEGKTQAAIETLKISGKKSGGVASLFSTHPPVEERIMILRDMEAGGVAETTGQPSTETP
jgi:heat shock protein HtpX